MICASAQSLASTGSRAGQGRPVRELAQLSSELTTFEFPQGGLFVVSNAAKQLHRALEQKPGRHGAIANLEEEFAGRKAARLLFGKPFHDGELRVP
jgi:hypothetical protein